ncbi:hypothetical protein R6Z07F_008129 [Ovis aries]
MGFRPGPRTGWWSGHRHLCLRSASLDPGREPRVGARAPRSGRTWHCPGEARGEGSPAGKQEVSGGAVGPLPREPRQPEASGEEGGAPESPLPREGPRGPGRVGLEQRRRPPREPSLQRGTG